jgi:hypothetical protein
VTYRTLTRYGFKIDNELTIGVAIAGMERFTKPRASLNEVPALALWASDSGIVWFINLLGMFTLRILATTNKHAEPPLTQYKNSTTCRA